MLKRKCVRSACGRPAVATLTYVHAEQTIVIGPMSTYAEPHTYDLCADHAERFTAPRGWDVVRLPIEYTEPAPSEDDLLALADAVRAAAAPAPTAAAPPAPEPEEGGPRLRVVRTR